MRYENWRNKVFLLIASLLDNTVGKELISFIFNHISFFILNLARSGFLLYAWSINKFNLVTKYYWQNVWSFISFVRCLTCFSSLPPLKLLAFFKSKDLKLTILFCFIISGILATGSKVGDSGLVCLSLKESFFCNVF